MNKEITILIILWMRNMIRMIILKKIFKTVGIILIIVVIIAKII